MSEAGRGRKKESEQPILKAITSANLSSYSGEWIALGREGVLAHNPSLKEAHRLAMEKAPGEKPVFFPVPASVTTY